MEIFKPIPSIPVDLHFNWSAGCGPFPTTTPMPLVRYKLAENEDVSNAIICFSIESRTLRVRVG